MSPQHPSTIFKTLVVSLAVISPLACESTGDNSAAKRGAAGGALLGLTLGALTGDAGLAAKGAVAGGVAGGVSGSMVDLENQRETERTAMLAGAIAGSRPADAPPSVPPSAQTWDRIDGMTGNWNVAIWGMDADGERINASASFYAQLASTTSVRFELKSFDTGSSGHANLTGYSILSYTPDAGYEMRNSYSDDPEEERWVGERLSGEERYNFYYVGAKEGNSDVRIEMRFVGQDVIIINTYKRSGAGESQVQEYRFSRS